MNFQNLKSIPKKKVLIYLSIIALIGYIVYTVFFKEHFDGYYNGDFAEFNASAVVVPTIISSEKLPMTELQTNALTMSGHSPDCPQAVTNGFGIPGINSKNKQFS